MCYKFYPLVSLLILSTLIGFSQNTFVPDDNFEQILIDLGFDTLPLDDYVPTANIINVQSLTLGSRNIQDLTGIEDFEALTQLFVQGNRLTTIDVSDNKNLQIFWCFNNMLPSIDVSKNLNLTSFRCEGNGLTTLDISNNTELTVLTCENNNLSTLDVSSNLKLSRLICSNNSIRNLDLKANINLSQLNCDGNNLTLLNLINNTKINILNCSNNFITELDLSLQTELIELNCSKNELCYLNLNNGNNDDTTLIDFTGNTDLTCVVVDDINSDRSFWTPLNFLNYVISVNECNMRIPVDSFEDFIGISYTLPKLIHGDYYSSSQGGGVPLFEGETITSSQTIYIYNEDDCFSNESSFKVLITEDCYLIPKYFTPNNDGKNDVWKVIDNKNLINNISIYNRYGQLLKSLNSASEGWDGTFKSKDLPNDSYWYEIVLNNKEIIRGYFALKR